MARKKGTKKTKIRRRPRRKPRGKIKLKKRLLPSSTSPSVYVEGPLRKTKIRIIGIGGGGGSIVSEIASRVKRASFVVANTDIQALKKSDKKSKIFQFGQKLTYGLGTGMNSELGKIAAQQEKEKIKKLLEGQDLCILVACLGGGTGSGAAPVFAKISRNLGNINYGVFTLPFKFEGEKKAQIARESLKKLKPNFNAFSVIPNERIFQIINKETPLRAALSVINKSLAESLEGLVEMIYDPGLINIDFADLKTIFEGRGRIAYLNTAEVSGSEKPEEAIKKIISNPLYSYTLRGARGVLFNISGEKNLGLNEISQISKTISDLANSEAKIIFGISHFPFSSAAGGLKGKKYRDKIKITLLATGCGAKIFSPKPKKTQRLNVSRKTKTAKKNLLHPKRRKFPKKKRKIESRPGKSSAAQKVKKAPKLLKLKQKIENLEETRKTEREPKKIEKKHFRKIKKAAKPVKVEITPVKDYKEMEKAQGRREEISKGIKVRRNALQIKKETEEAEQDLLNQEKKWETPAFLRKKLTKSEQ